MTFVEFLNARLDEDEAAAKAATPGGWQARLSEYGPNGEWEIVTDAHEPSEPGRYVVYTGYEGGGVTSEQNAVHIARHDPARVLREVAAKRSLLTQHRPASAEALHPWCRVSIRTDPEIGTYQEPFPCPTLRVLAVSYADHPDYQEAWKL